MLLPHGTGIAARKLFRDSRDKALRLAMRHALSRKRGVSLVRIGSAYGGWIVPCVVLRKGAVCYSAGLGEDGSFDLELAQSYGCNVFVFDPTPRAISYAESRLSGIPGVEFRPVGLWSKRETLKFYAPRDPFHVSHSAVNLQQTTEYFEAECEAVEDAMTELDHTKVDLLKLDIEGAEFEVLKSVLASGLDITAVCVEFDQPTPVRKILQQIRQLRIAGYSLVAIEAWNYTFLRFGKDRALAS